MVPDINKADGLRINSGETEPWAQGGWAFHMTWADRGQWGVGLTQSVGQLDKESSKPIILEKLGVEEKDMENETVSR